MSDGPSAHCVDRCRNWQRSTGRGHVTHDPDEASSSSDRIIESPFGVLFVVSRALTDPLRAGDDVSVRFLPEAGGVVVL